LTGIPRSSSDASARWSGSTRWGDEYVAARDRWSVSSAKPGSASRASLALSTAQGQDEEGMAQMQRGLAARQATGNLNYRAAYLALLGELRPGCVAWPRRWS
jgi:hypothetical protein